MTAPIPAEDLAGHFGLGVPYWRETGHHVRRVDLVYRFGADLGMGVGGETGSPVFLGAPAGFPLGAVEGYHRFRGFLECWDAGRSGISPVGDRSAVGKRPFAGLGQGDHRIRTEPEVGFPPVDADTLRPRFGHAPVAALFDHERKTVTAASVAVSSGLADGLDERCGERGRSFHSDHPVSCAMRCAISIAYDSV